jgi:cytohesin
MTDTGWYGADWPEHVVFLSAVGREDVAKVESMLRAGVSPDTLNTDGEPALVFAARLEKPRATELLLRAGADVRLADRYGLTALHCLAAYPRLLHLVPLALKLGAEVDAATLWGQTPLATALRRACIPGAELMLEVRADPHSHDKYGSSLLHQFIAGIYSFRDGDDHGPQLRMIERLIGLGNDPREPGEYGRTAVTVAAERGLRQVMATFAGAGIDLGAADRRPVTPLQAAAVAGHRELARDLLSRGVTLDGFSAASLGDVSAVRRLVVEGGATVDAVLPEPRATMLAVAIRHGHADAVRALLELGADPRGPDPWTSSLHNAVRHLPDPEILRGLIAHGARVDAGDGDNNTPLNFAARDDRLDLAQVLLDAGADPNAETERGYTVSSFAASDAMRDLLRRHGGR